MSERPGMGLFFRHVGQQPQRQDSLDDQLRDLHRVAARLGCYDAADWVWLALRRQATPQLRRGAMNLARVTAEDERLRVAWNAGYEHGKAGGSRSGDPHINVDSDLHIAWDEGWITGAEAWDRDRLGFDDEEES